VKVADGGSKLVLTADEFVWGSKLMRMTTQVGWWDQLVRSTGEDCKGAGLCWGCLERPVNEVSWFKLMRSLLRSSWWCCCWGQADGFSWWGQQRQGSLWSWQTRSGDEVFKGRPLLRSSVEVSGWGWWVRSADELSWWGRLMTFGWWSLHRLVSWCWRGVPAGCWFPGSWK
jgi:hypothetical protein